MGATGLLGQCLLPLLAEKGWRVTAFSRRPVKVTANGVTWRTLDEPAVEGEIPSWVSAVPIWALPAHFDRLRQYSARRVVALSSTSRYTKTDSSDADERAVALRLAEGEERLKVWAEKNGIEWVLLRPTLLYGRGRDKNISEIAHIIRRLGAFPLFGHAMGLRQPVHAEDVASACVAALVTPAATNHAYNLSGGEALPYREMVRRVSSALGRRPHLLTVPPAIFRLMVWCIRQFPRYRHWSMSMAMRMNRDMIFDNTEAVRDLGFAPRPFKLGKQDLPTDCR